SECHCRSSGCPVASIADRTSPLRHSSTGDCLMRPRSLLRPIVIVVLASGPVVAQVVAQEPAKPAPSPSEVSLEVNALQTLRQFKLNTSQMQKLQKWAKETAAPERVRDSKASKEFREKLGDLANALFDDNDEQIDQLNEQLDDLRQAEKPS